MISGCSLCMDFLLTSHRLGGPDDTHRHEEPADSRKHRGNSGQNGTENKSRDQN